MVTSLEPPIDPLHEMTPQPPQLGQGGPGWRGLPQHSGQITRYRRQRHQQTGDPTWGPPGSGLLLAVVLMLQFWFLVVLIVLGLIGDLGW